MSLNQVKVFILFQKEELEVKTRVFKRRQMISIAAKVSLFFMGGKVSAGKNFKMLISGSLLITSNI